MRDLVWFSGSGNDAADSSSERSARARVSLSAAASTMEAWARSMRPAIHVRIQERARAAEAMENGVARIAGARDLKASLHALAWRRG